MRIFVGYGFDKDHDRWIPDLVFPIIEAFGDEVVTGEDLQGDKITDAVIRKIKNSNGLLGFVTRRDNAEGNRWTTHRWVTDEISAAITAELLVAEVRETGVDEQGGIAGDRQRITYNENERDKCLVEITKTIGQWHTYGEREIQIYPAECAEAIARLRNNPRLRCTYKILENGRESAEISTRIIARAGGLVIYPKNISPSSFIEVHVECEAQAWRSEYSSIMLGVELQKE